MRFIFASGLVLLSLFSLGKADSCADGTCSSADSCSSTLPVVQHTVGELNPKCNFYTFGMDTGRDGPTLFVANYGCDENNYPIEGEHGKCQVGSQVRPCVVDKSGKGDGRSMPIVYHRKGNPASKCNFYTYAIDGPKLYLTNHECVEGKAVIKGYDDCELDGQATKCLVVNGYY